MVNTRILGCLIVMCLAVGHQALATDYYVEPLRGNMANAGTSDSPWSTLADVFSSGKSFQPGDRLLLGRGYHGAPTVTGKNTADVFIVPQPGQTPLVRSLSLLNADHWNIKGLNISQSTTPAGSPDSANKVSGVVIDNQTNENSDYNTIEGCAIYGAQVTTNWTESDWANKPGGGIAVFGNYNSLKGNHLYNAGGIQLGYHSNNAYVGYNTVENISGDGMGQKGNYGLFEHNLVMNSHKVNGNHNDLFQGWASTGNVLDSNEFRAYSDPNQPFLLSPGLSDVQGIGLFDGWYDSWTIKNNVVLVDHPIGIWIQGGKNCKILNNTIARCGQNAWSEDRPPNILLAAKKSGAASTNNVVENNIAERFELDDSANANTSIGIVSNNTVIAKSAFTATYLNWSKKDLRLKAGATSVIDTGTSANSAPLYDKDGNPRPYGPVLDEGAYEYGYLTQADTAGPSKPIGLTGVAIPGYGVDLQWAPASDNREVAGYDIFLAGVQVGRTRAGTNFFALNSNTTGAYTVQAFDPSGNISAMSSAVTYVPEPASLTLMVLGGLTLLIKRHRKA